jgi:hypothetical protein
VLFIKWVVGSRMVRFKNRYLVLELLWKDGRLDETLSAWWGEA